jgi:hypothetical protein
LDKKNEISICFTKIGRLYIATTSFNLWISKGAHDIFALLINFLGSYWQPKQVTIGLFETIGSSGQNLTTNLKKLLDQYGLRKNYICER